MSFEESVEAYLRDIKNTVIHNNGLLMGMSQNVVELLDPAQARTAAYRRQTEAIEYIDSQMPELNNMMTKGYLEPHNVKEILLHLRSIILGTNKT